MSEVLVVGGANLDVVSRVGGHLTMGTSNPGLTRRTPGGVGRNIAANMALLGDSVTLMAPIGPDAAGEEIRASVPHVITLPARRTGSYTAVLDADGELVIAVADMAATDALRPDDVAEEPFDGARYVVLEANLPPDTLVRCLALADRAGAQVILDPVSVAKASRLGRLEGQRVHTVTPNSAELLALARTDQVRVAIERLRGSFPDRVWLRDGASGSTLIERDGSTTHIPAFPVQVVDVTGAGDAMVAAYVHRLLRGDAPAVAATYGATAASLTLEVRGAVRRDLSADLLEQRHAAQLSEETR